MKEKRTIALLGHSFFWWYITKGTGGVFNTHHGFIYPFLVGSLFFMILSLLFSDKNENRILNIGIILSLTTIIIYAILWIAKYWGGLY